MAAELTGLIRISDNLFLYYLNSFSVELVKKFK